MDGWMDRLMDWMDVGICALAHLEQEIRSFRFPSFSEREGEAPGKAFCLGATPTTAGADAARCDERLRRSGWFIPVIPVYSCVFPCIIVYGVLCVGLLTRCDHAVVGAFAARERLAGAGRAAGRGTTRRLDLTEQVGTVGRYIA
jgi:hypothetical protein